MKTDFLPEPTENEPKYFSYLRKYFEEIQSMEDSMIQNKCDFKTQVGFTRRLIDIIESVAWWYVWGEEKAKFICEQNNRWQYYAESILNLYKDTNQVPDTILPPGWKIIN
jgi:hypothetical protein